MHRSFIDGFAGGGGAGEGLEEAGLECLLSIEWDAICRETLRINRPKSNIDDADLFERSIADVISSHGIGSDYDGLIWVSPPCQDVSECGPKNGWWGERNSLLFSTIDACDAYPRAWVVMENVPGLVNLRAREIFEELLQGITDTGRQFDVHILSALNWMLAQERIRLFIACSPIGVGVLPEPVGPWAGMPPITLRQAIHPGSGFIDPDPEPWPLKYNEPVIYAPIPAGGNYLDSWRGRLYAADMFERSRLAGRASWRMRREKNFLGRLSWELPAPTIPACPPRMSCFRCYFPHPEQARFLSNGECRKLQGFPAWYVFAGNKAQRRRQIGNAVPPPLSKGIAQAILQFMQT